MTDLQSGYLGLNPDLFITYVTVAKLRILSKAVSLIVQWIQNGTPPGGLL